MPADYTISTAHRVILSYAWGVFTFEDAKLHRARLLQDRDFSPDHRQYMHLLDVSHIEMSSDEIRYLAHGTVLAPHSRRAMVAPLNLPFGLSRMFEAYSDQQTVRVFRRVDEAAAWLELPSDVIPIAIARFREARGAAPDPGLSAPRT